MLAPFELDISRIPRARVRTGDRSNAVWVGYLGVDESGNVLSGSEPFKFYPGTQWQQLMRVASPERRVQALGPIPRDAIDAGDIVANVVVPPTEGIDITTPNGTVVVHGLRAVEINADRRHRLPVDMSGQDPPGPSGAVLGEGLVIRSDADSVAVADVPGQVDVHNTGDIAVSQVSGDCHLVSDNGEINAESIGGGALLRNGAGLTPSDLAELLDGMRSLLPARGGDQRHIRAGGRAGRPGITAIGIERDVIAMSLLGGPIEVIDLGGRAVTFRTGRSDPLAAFRATQRGESDVLTPRERAKAAMDPPSDASTEPADGPDKGSKPPAAGPERRHQRGL